MDDDDDAPGLTPGASHAVIDEAGWEFQGDYILTPLPPHGPVRFLCAWPAAGIPESAATVDAAVFRDAAARAIRLWQP